MAEITLRAIEKDDLDVIQIWRNSPNVLPYCRQYRPLSMEDMEAWYEKLHKDKDYNLTNDLFVIENKGRQIGVGGFVRIDWRNRKAELSFYVGEGTDRTEEVITESILAIVGYGFKTLGLHKVYFPVYAANPYLSIYEKVLTREYIAKEEYYWEGKFHDRIILVAYEHI